MVQALSFEMIEFETEEQADEYLLNNPDETIDTTHEGQSAKKMTQHEKEYLGDMLKWYIKRFIFLVYGIPLP